MKIHHLNCISSCPLGGALMDGRGLSVARRGELACHCLLVELPDSLLLVDTGYGLRDVADPRSRLSPFFLALMSPDFREDMTALRQIQRLGYASRDVRHIVLTHLDFDHAGGIDDFPQARVHMLKQEADDALLQKSWLDRQRFRPEQWTDRSQWRTYEPGAGDAWNGFDCVRAMAGLPPEVLLVPLRGHTFGHAGVAIQQGDRWLLHAGDAYFDRREMDVDRPRCTPGLRLYQTMMEKDRKARLTNQARLRQLAAAQRSNLDVFCAHDPFEFEHHAGHPMQRPPAGHRHDDAPTHDRMNLLRSLRPR